MIDRSKVFSDVWMRSIFTQPDLDYTLITPVNQKARHVALDLEKDRIHQTIKSLSQTYGLFFFFSGGCKFCHAFAPIVKEFSQTYGWEVLAITLDGEKEESFERPLPDNGLFKKWGSDVLPAALYAVNLETGHVIPVALGMVSLDQMETRIMKLVEESQ